MIRRFVVAATAALALSAAFSSASAQTAHRAWVSGHGVDSAGCGAPTAPCRSLQYVHDHIAAAGGEIDILDPAGYGAVAINKAISIINDGVGTAGVQATTGAAITVSAGPTDAVLLRGLDIEGVGASNGVVLLSGGSLTVEDSAINGFSQIGLFYQPSASSYLFVSNTRVANNADWGILVGPVISGSAAVRATMTRVEAINDGVGVEASGTGSAAGVVIIAALADSVATNNASIGLGAATGPSTGSAFLMVCNCTVTHSDVGVEVNGAAASIDLAHSTVAGTNTVFSAANGGVIRSFGDNAIDGNVSPGSTPTTVGLQ